MRRQLRRVTRSVKPRLLGVPREALVMVGGVLALRVVRRHRHRHILRRRLMRRPEVRAGAGQVREWRQGCGLERVVGGQGEVGADGAVSEEHGAAIEVVEAVGWRGRGLHRLLLLRRRSERSRRRRRVAGV
ncbi:hypothetical protein PR202_ga26995 [Eleusine coracana subsp. coracana]|uniref:Uncharacterized protein n=1 Tax=Eleusine coracana subsp. coracana TaxID=191504 RepID=A0AAV5DDH0_ELECO|nr:hypothetical protein PR202_ga26995 [Eleusine coracana subsp. coracana]